MNRTEVYNQIRDFIIKNMEAFNDGEDLADSDNIFEKGFVSSIFAIRLLHFIESKFDIEVSDEMIVLENFSSVDNIANLVKQLKGRNTHAN
ncbi:phosphopantetheine-binding protein [Oceanobacillus manasiensis]|uniref:phosphopantetheine-binding protein n=1 Tax=Oceanobacillus manasiensis TaxID=586413 RepID=UPI000A75D1B2|nr:phosphopantetheine-binding protein [Oceanobacillus manasiensis]